jgi:hypothetical protein
MIGLQGGAAPRMNVPPAAIGREWEAVDRLAAHSVSDGGDWEGATGPAAPAPW